MALVAEGRMATEVTPMLHACQELGQESGEGSQAIGPDVYDDY